MKPSSAPDRRGDGAALTYVVPQYGYESYLASTLGAIRAQTREDWEVVIVQQGATADFERIMADHADDPRIRAVRLPEAVGIFHARRLGVAECRTPYVALIDADDTVTPIHAESTLARLEDSGADLVIGRATSHAEGREPFVIPFRNEKENGPPPMEGRGADSLDYGIRSDLYPNWTCVYRREFLERVYAEFPPDFRTNHAEDVVLKLVVWSRLPHFVRTEAVIYRYNIHPDSYMRQTDEARLAEKQLGALDAYRHVYDLFRADAELCARFPHLPGYVASRAMRTIHFTVWSVGDLQDRTAEERYEALADHDFDTATLLAGCNAFGEQQAIVKRLRGKQKKQMKRIDTLKAKIEAQAAEIARLKASGS